MDGNLTVAGRATTTASSGNFAVRGSIGSGTSTPQGGDIAVTTVAATTTLYIAAETTTKGGCIQLQSASGSPYRLYIGTNDYATVTGTTGRAGLEAVWEYGACK